MAQQIISVFVFTLFFSKALTLMCYNCTVPYKTCPESNCSFSTRCLSNITYIDGSMVYGTRNCGGVPDGNWSVNLGRLRHTMKVCSSDLCNTATDSTNGKSCYTCNGTDCSQTMSCKGDETQCITATDASNSTFKGCASQSVCTYSTAMENVTSQYGFAITGGSCCDGNLCNNGQILRQRAVLLLIPVLSLFSPSEICF